MHPYLQTMLLIWRAKDSECMVGYSEAWLLPINTFLDEKPEDTDGQIPVDCLSSHIWISLYYLTHLKRR